MDPCASSRPSGSVGIVALDLLRRVFAVGRPRRLKRNSRELKRLEGYGKLQSREYLNSSRSESWTTDENSNEGYDWDNLLEEDEELMELTKHCDLRERQRSSISSNDSSKRWSSSDQYYHRRRKGFYCMRLRIVNMAKLMAMMRKVRVAYRRMMNAAAASKTILSLSDLYNDIADLIPVPGSSSSSKVRTIVVIRPIKRAADGAEELPASTLASEPSSTTSRTFACEMNGRLRQTVGHDVKSTLISPAVDHENFTCRKFPFPRFSRAFGMSSCTWKTSSTA